MMQNNSNFDSHLITLDDVIKKDYFFNIPIYQRLYVWKKEQIHTLLNDIVQAFEEGKEEFYLGGTLVIERKNMASVPDVSAHLFDLIDGQQRFTTLWLISVVLRGALTKYCQVQTQTDTFLRIGFAIRPAVKEYFQRTLRGEKVHLPEARQLEDALDEINSFFKNYKNTTNRDLNLDDLATFIRDKVQLVLTRVPENTDLNKLFEVINNRGVQLQHHEILKAKLLGFIDKSERAQYGYIWDACSNMNDYVERNLRSATQIDTVKLFNNNDNLARADQVIAELENHTQNQERIELDLETILSSTSSYSSKIKKDDDTSELPDRVNSIISFSMLLQHVLRIFLFRSNFASKDIERVSDKDLLVIFKTHWLETNATAEHIKKFISLLWEVRYQFDKHIIKWIVIEEVKVHSIRRLYVNTSNDNSYLQRQTKDADSDFALLQSMLYHSQQMTTQYWLTPLLNYLLKNESSSGRNYLQHLDNNLFCSEDKSTLIERTYKYVVKPWHTEPLIPASISLNQIFNNGVEYPHYWFYKLEYILYLRMKGDKKLSQLVESFRITAKNSVEHIAPQNPENDNDKVNGSVLHRFGNLALVTRSLNSELSNKGYIIKQAEFKHRHQGKGVSLKLEHVFKNDKWTETEIESHQIEMIRYFDQYLYDTNAQNTGAVL